MANILPGIVPLQVSDVCTTSTPINCGDEGASSDNTSATFDILYPTGATTLPLAGGAVVSVGAENLKLTPSPNVDAILTRNLTTLQGLGLQNTLKDLNRSRIAVNNALFDIARRDLKVLDENKDKRKAPSVFVASFIGEDKSVLEDGISNPDMIRLCELRYIPFEAFGRLLTNLLDDLSIDFNDAVGVAGRKYSELDSIAGDNATDSNVVDLVLEFFPVVNISETTLSSNRSNPVIGGYYTIKNDKIFMKLPDLSGRNSAGEANGLINSESSLYIEILSGPSLTRAEIDSFKMPPIASFVGDQQSEFPDLSSLEVVFEMAEEETVTVYLSPIVRGLTVNKRRSLEVFSDFIELFSVPLLTKPIEDGRLPILSEDSTPSTDDIVSLGPVVDLYYPGFSSSNPNPENTGYPYVFASQEDPHVFFGEKNRPDAILTDPDGESVNKNNRRYFNLSSYGALEVLASTMPKIYNGVPSEWASSIPSQDSDGNYVATFSAIPFDGIDLAQLGGSIEYVVYVADSLGQVTRVIGPYLSLSNATPSITTLSPDGFGGSTALVLNDANIIQIDGEDLGGVQQVVFTPAAGTPVTVVVGDGVASEPTNTSVTLSFAAQTDIANLENSMASRGFISGTEYRVTLQSGSADLVSQEDAIYVVADSTDDRPVKTQLLATFKSDEFKSTEFGTNPIVGIPLFKNGLSADIGIKSKSKLFKGDRAIYAYIALPEGNEERLSSFAFPNRVVTATTNVGNLLVPIDIQYTFSKSIAADFSKDPLSNKRATLSFPGTAYAGYNFSSLEGLDEGYILFTNRPIPELVGSGTSIVLEDDGHGTLRLGDSDPGGSSAFIEPSTILGIAADIGGDSILSTFSEGTFILPDDVFGGTKITVDEINTTGTLNRIALIVSGIKERFIRKRFDIKLGGTDITKKISRDPEVLGRDQLLFVLSNVTPINDGILSFTIDKKEKRFGSNYSTTGYSAQASAIVNGEPGLFFDIDNKTGALTTKTEITSDTLVTNLETFLGDIANLYAIVGGPGQEGDTNVLDALYPDSDTNGFITDRTQTTFEDSYIFFEPVDITPTTKLKLRTDPSDPFKITTLSPGFAETGINGLIRSTLVVGSGAVFPSGTYALNQNNDAALLFFNTFTEGLASIKYNVPEVIAIGEEDEEPILLSSGEKIPIVVGRKYTAIVKNTDRDFVLKFDEIVIKPRGRPRPTGNPGEYEAKFEAPITLLDIPVVDGNCFEVCASSENSTRNRAKFDLGRDFVIDLDEIFQEMLLGPLKDKIPDIEGLFEKLANAPLRFVSFLLDKANIPKDLIKSFCDLSFHLVAELKISLNGFRVLMIPIQVIFCIIDVICALLNPVKIAKAVIRLFQCLYDLILLLPIISVPVMLLQLILHLLELIQCVIDKILFTMTAINEISRAINNAAQKPINFAAIKALEETLSEYLFEIDADLTFLEPILSILAIFLQLLQLLFRFPCTIDPGDGASDCGVDGTLLAGIVAGIAAPDLEIIPDVMLPVGQTYSLDEIEGDTNDIKEPAIGEAIAFQTATETYLDSMEIDQDSLRTPHDNSTALPAGIDHAGTMAPTFTKSKKKAGKPTQVEFQFKGRGLSGLNNKNIDPNQTVDTPLAFLRKNGDNLQIANQGNLYSPIDGSPFLDINQTEGTASVKPLILEFEVPVFGTDPETGLPIQTDVEIVTRTFDNIPKMVVMDDEFNVYFIQNDGIVFDDDGFVESITADIVNTVSAPKMKFSREDAEIDDDGDPDTDPVEIRIFDFPQLYFFDMRQAGEQLEQFCSTASINSFPFEDNDAEEIEEIVEDAQTCLETWLAGVRGLVDDVRTAQQSGALPLPEINTDTFSSLNEELIECLGGTADDICKFVINGLNTSFKILEDDDETPLGGFTDGDISEEILEGFNEIGPPFTGAREYAAGIGDSASITVGGTANIELIPRDSYDEEIIGDLSDRITLEIVSDSTGTAEFIRNEDNSIITKDGTAYRAKLTASKIGEVRLRARICDRTVQALTFEGVSSDVVAITGGSESEVDCIPDTISEITGSEGSSPLGALTKVDRLLNVYFVKGTSISATLRASEDGGAELPNTRPQQSGTTLEN